MEHLRGLTEADMLSMHDVGPRAVEELKKALAGMYEQWKEENND